MAKVIEKRSDGTVVIVVSSADASELEVGAAVDVLPKATQNGEDQRWPVGVLADELPAMRSPTSRLPVTRRCSARPSRPLSVTRVLADTHALLWMLKGTLRERSSSGADAVEQALDAKALFVSIGSF